MTRAAHLRAALSVVALASITSGCREPCGGGCRSDEQCTDGACVRGCNSHADCARGRCESGRCMDGQPPASSSAAGPSSATESSSWLASSASRSSGSSSAAPRSSSSASFPSSGPVPQSSSAAPASSCAAQDDATLCTDVSAQRGALSAWDRCGQLRPVDCGPCLATAERCVANLCVCLPETDAAFCVRNGVECGAFSGTDNCGAPRSVTVCAACTGTGQTCSNNQCGCIPLTDVELCAVAYADCGSADLVDNCGAARPAVDCGSCTGAGETCSAGNQCVCIPESNAGYCQRLQATCGTVSQPDNCGYPRSLGCGTCTGTQVCMASATCCTPETLASFCTRHAVQCGSVSGPDNCEVQRTRDCGPCTAAGEGCVAGQCTPLAGTWRFVGVLNTTFAGTTTWQGMAALPSGTLRFALAVWAAEAENLDVTGNQGNYTVTLGPALDTCTRADTPWPATVEGGCYVATDPSVDLLWDDNFPGAAIVECDVRHTAATHVVELQDTSVAEDCAVAVFAYGP